jgi:DNA-directed RNA polymerase II subunit RPB1
MAQNLLSLINSVNKPPKFNHAVASKLSKKEQQKYINIRPTISHKEYEMITSKTHSMMDSLLPNSIEETCIMAVNHDTIVNNLSVCLVNQNNSFEEMQRRMAYDPRPGTIDDPSMGVLSKEYTCATCNETMGDCPGHYGRIEFPKSIIHPSHRKTVTALNNCFCRVCFQPIYTKFIVDKYKHHTLMDRLKHIAKDCVTMNQKDFKIHHPNCGQKLVYVIGPKELREKPKKEGYNGYEKADDNIRYSIFEKIEIDREISYIPVDPDEIYTFFENISQDFLIPNTTSVINNIKNLGFNTDITSFIMRSILVAPPITRPYGMLKDEQTMHPLSQLYCDLLTCCEEIKQLQGANKSINKLFDKIVEIMVWVQDTLQGKEGVIRGLSMGKRVDYSGRSVLNPRNELKFGEIGCPSVMRQIHTKVVNVTDYNVGVLAEMFRAKQVAFITFGSTIAFKSDKVKVKDTLLASYVPQVGDILEIIGQDGDEVLFNRQPSLSKYSIMGYKAKYIPGLVLGVLSAYTTPHNADFDGDEANVHKIQTYAARAEVRTFANIEACGMDSRTSKPVIGLVYNNTTAAYLISLESAMIEPRYWPEAIEVTKNNEGMDTLEQRLDEAGVKMYSGRALFSTLLPSNFYYNEGDIRIRNGILISGTLKSSNVGPVHKSIFHHLWKSGHPARANQFLSQGQWVLDWYIMHRGFSVGFSSCIPNNQTAVDEIIQSEINKSQLEIEKIGMATEDMTPLEQELIEKKTMAALNNVSAIGAAIIDRGILPDNPLTVMCNSGAKGKTTNIGQITGCLGQVYVQGSRPKQNLTLNTRCLPYFEPYSSNINAHGFVSESFMDGIDPAGFIFHMMASRVGVMDTALKTADIGHMHHRMVKAQEDLIADYDGSTRNSAKVLFNEIYGADGFNAGELIRSDSVATGKILSFIDLKHSVGRLNMLSGYENNQYN